MAEQLDQDRSPGALPFDREGPWLNTDRPVDARVLSGRRAIVHAWRLDDVRSTLEAVAIGRWASARPDVLAVGVHSPLADGDTVERVRDAILRHGLVQPVFVADPADLAGVDPLEPSKGAWVLDPDGADPTHIPSPLHPEALEQGLGRPVTRDASTSGGPPPALRGEAAGPTRLLHPEAVTPAPGGDGWIVADTGHHQLVHLDEHGTVRSVVGSGRPGLVDGGPDEACFHGPRGLALVEDELLVADSLAHAVRIVDLEGGHVRTLVGGREADGGEPHPIDPRGPAPWDVTVPAGREPARAIVAAPGEGTILEIDLDDGEARRLARVPDIVRVESGGGSVWAASADGQLHRLAPSRGSPKQAPSQRTLPDRLVEPGGIAWDPDREALLVADAWTGRLFSVDPAQGPHGVRTELAPLDSQALAGPRAMCFSGGRVLVAETQANQLRWLHPEGGKATAFELHWPHPDADVHAELDPVELAPGGELELILEASAGDDGSLDPGASKLPSVRGPISVHEPIETEPRDPRRIVARVTGELAATGWIELSWTLALDGESAGTRAHTAIWRLAGIVRPGAPSHERLVLSTRAGAGPEG